MKNTIFGVGKLNLLVRLFAAVENRTPVISQKCIVILGKEAFLLSDF